MIICKICNQNIEAKYKCPKCSIDYCSLKCFKSPQHTKCSEEFYEEQVHGKLKSEQYSQVSDEREAMLKILAQLQRLDASSDDDNDEQEADLEAWDQVDDLDELNEAELEALLGPKHLGHLKELISQGVTQEWLKTAEISVDPKEPWFMLPEASLPLMAEGVPEFASLTQKRPSDFLWNNLMEIVFIYAFICFEFTADELKNGQILENEVLPSLLELSQALQPSNSRSTLEVYDGGFYYSSALESFEAAKSAVFMNSSTMSQSKMAQIFQGVKSLLGNIRRLQLMVSDLLSWTETGGIFKKNSDYFKLNKKLIFLFAWLRAEQLASPEAVKEILQSLQVILEQFFPDSFEVSDADSLK